MNGLKKLEDWYSEQCDGDWEHEFGIRIENIDNPGWKIVIPLEKTIYESLFFEEIEVNRTENDWIHCKKDEGHFKGWGGSNNLNDILKIFFSWVDKVAWVEE